MNPLGRVVAVGVRGNPSGLRRKSLAPHTGMLNWRFESHGTVLPPHSSLLTSTASPTVSPRQMLSLR
eukprot:3871339-Prymnesium_polylepis.1